LTEKNEVIHGLHECEQNPELEVIQLQNAKRKTIVVGMLGSPSSTFHDLDCRKLDVDNFASSHDFLSPIFEKNTTTIRSQL